MRVRVRVLTKPEKVQINLIDMNCDGLILLKLSKAAFNSYKTLNK